MPNQLAGWLLSTSKDEAFHQTKLLLVELLKMQLNCAKNLLSGQTIQISIPFIAKVLFKYFPDSLRSS